LTESSAATELSTKPMLPEDAMGYDLQQASFTSRMGLRQLRLRGEIIKKWAGK
jgi:hypothetical protein